MKISKPTLYGPELKVLFPPLLKLKKGTPYHVLHKYINMFFLAVFAKRRRVSLWFLVCLRRKTEILSLGLFTSLTLIFVYSFVSSMKTWSVWIS